MTRIHPGRPLRRETDALCSHFPIVIELHPKYLTLRLKGERQGHDLTYEAILHFAWRQAADARARKRTRQPTLRRIA